MINVGALETMSRDQLIAMIKEFHQCRAWEIGDGVIVDEEGNEQWS